MNSKTLIFNPVSYPYSFPEFYGNDVLDTVIFGDHVQKIPGSILAGQSQLKNVTIPNSVMSIGCFAFQNCKGLTQIILPPSLITIDCFAFEGCTGLTSITIPDAVTSILDYSFRSCSALSNINFGKSVNKIGDQAFRNCTELTSVYLPNSVTTIGKQVFWDCSKLAVAVLGSGITSLDHAAVFSGCSQLTDVICLATTPPTFKSEGTYYYPNTTLHVLPESLEAYQTAPKWQYLFCQILGDVIIDIPGDVNGDGEITVADANSAIKIIISGGNGHSRAPGDEDYEEFNKADVNGDGEVNIADLNAIIDLILKG